MACCLIAGLGAKLLSAGEDAGLAHVAGVHLVAPAHPARRADFQGELASGETRHIANWVVDAGDNHAQPFVILDKAAAKVFVFDAEGRLRGASSVLLGLAVGDDAVPNIGNRRLSSILPHERTTPAGRFEAALGRNLHGDEILWVDYGLAISLHRVLTSNPLERRLQRLNMSAPLAHRITYGCINVPVKFYEQVVSPTFTGTGGVVYVLPETRSAQGLFASYDVDGRSRQLHEAGGL
jgi:hypothetical protein